MPRILKTILRILLGAVFFYAGSISIRSPEQFADSIAGYRMLPAIAIVPLALTLPPLEILVGVFLIVGRPPRMATVAALLLTVVFIIALSSALARGLVIDCSCFGHETPSRWSMWFSLGRDVLLGGALAALYRDEFRRAPIWKESIPCAACKK